MYSSSSREGKNGGTTSMCVEKVTNGSSHVASTLKRPGSTSRRSALPPVRAASSDRYSSRYTPTACSLFVIDSISVNARVSSNTFICDTRAPILCVLEG